MKKVTKTSDILQNIDGMYRITDTDYVFVKNFNKSKRAKIVRKDTLTEADKIIYCDNCHVLPAVQLDSCYTRGVHDFTLCNICLKELEDN